jgi:hypothetical protein
MSLLSDIADDEEGFPSAAARPWPRDNEHGDLGTLGGTSGPPGSLVSTTATPLSLESLPTHDSHSALDYVKCSPVEDQGSSSMSGVTSDSSHGPAVWSISNVPGNTAYVVLAV